MNCPRCWQTAKYRRLVNLHGNSMWHEFTCPSCGTDFMVQKNQEEMREDRELLDRLNAERSEPSDTNESADTAGGS